MAGKIFYEFALPDDPFLDRFTSGYETTDSYFRSRRWFKAERGRSSPPTYAFRTAEGGPIVGYCAFDFRKQPHPDSASTTKARYLVIYMIGVDRAFHGTKNPLTPKQTYALHQQNVTKNSRHLVTLRFPLPGWWHGPGRVPAQRFVRTISTSLATVTQRSDRC